MTRNRIIPLPMAEAVKRPLKNLRMAASTSFTGPEIEVLAALLERLRRGGDTGTIMKAPEVNQIARKIVTMRQTIERQRERRREKCREAHHE